MRTDFIITGGSGYIGGRLKRKISKNGSSYYEITRDHVLTPTGQYLHNSDSGKIANLIADRSDPVLIHLAGLFIARHTPDDIPNLINANVTFATQVFDAFARAGYKNVVNAGTSWQFASDGKRAPINLYAASKVAGQDILDYFVQQTKLSAISLVIYDTYGPNDNRPKLLPLLRKTWLDGTELKMTSGEQPLNLVHVDDVVDAILQAASNVSTMPRMHHKLAAVRSSTDISVRDLVELIKAEIAPEIRVQIGALPDSTAPKGLCHKISSVANWSQKIELIDGLKDIFCEKARHDD